MKHNNLYLLCLAAGLLFTTCKKETALFPGGVNGQTTGASAHDLLSSAKYNSLVIEIQYMPGFQPDQQAIANLKNQLSGFLNKPGGITVTQTQISSTGKSKLTLDDIIDIEQKNRTQFSDGDKIAAYFVCVDAGYVDDNANGQVLGVAYRNTSMAIFQKTIQDNSGSITQPSRTKLETTVIEHEFGHILGLVDLGTPMKSNHKDSAHGNHCNVSSCLMYWSVETTDILGNLITGNIPTLDSQCVADLKANGSK